MSEYIDPEREQFEAFKQLPRDEPVMMLNLLRFRDKAAYEDGREASGAEAYAAYGEASGPIFGRVGIWLMPSIRYSTGSSTVWTFRVGLLRI